MWNSRSWIVLFGMALAGCGKANDVGDAPKATSASNNQAAQPEDSLESKDPDVRAKAAATYVKQHAYSPTHAKQSLSDKRPVVRYAAASSLIDSHLNGTDIGDKGPLLAVLVEALSDTETRVHQEFHVTERVGNQLVSQPRDVTISAKNVGAYGIAKLGHINLSVHSELTNQAIPLLIKMLNQKDVTALNVFDALRAIGPKALDQTLPLMKHDDPKVWKPAANLLENWAIGNQKEKVVPLMQEIAKDDSNPAKQMTAQYVLKRIAEFETPANAPPQN